MARPSPWAWPEHGKRWDGQIAIGTASLAFSTGSDRIANSNTYTLKKATFSFAKEKVSLFVN
jgi:hypothetical protein